MQDIHSSLRQWDLFSHFRDADIRAVSLCVARRHYPDGAEVVRQNDMTSDAYFIETGMVRIQRETNYGLYILAQLESGELFGEASYIDRLGRSGDVVTVGVTELLVFNPAVLSELTREDQQLDLALHWTFWRSLSDKLRSANEHLVRFFTDGKIQAASAPVSPRADGDAYQVGIAAKRRLFEEQKLSTMEIHFLSSLSREKKFASGEVIFREGETAEGMYVVLEGQVRISKDIPGAGEEALAFLERGDYFGEMALIDRRPRSADARAHTGGAVVLAIPNEVVEGILDIRSRVSSLRLLKLLCSLVTKRLREIDEKIIGWFMLSGGGDEMG